MATLRTPKTSRTRAPKAAHTSRRPPQSVPVKRDPEQTQARILTAATAEFADKGFSGARTDQIAQRAQTNVRMLYHYHGSKDGLYTHVLEGALAELRHQELQLDVSDAAPLEGILQLFDFIDGHFSTHPELLQLLAYENLNKAAHLSASVRIAQQASPVLDMIRKLLTRGQADGSLRGDIDALHLYVSMVSLAYYGKSHAYTLSRIFNQDILAADWQTAHRIQHHQMLQGLLQPLTAHPRPASRPSTRSTSRLSSQRKP